MKKGFTLIELIVVVGVVGLLVGGAIIYFNQSKSVQKLAATKSELVANLRMARNYARTMQVPAGYSSSLAYVGVTINSDGTTRIYPIPAGSDYFLKDISPVGVSIGVSPTEIFFAVYDGKLLKSDGVIVPRAAGEVVVVTITSTEGVGNTELVRIRATGLVNE